MTTYREQVKDAVFHYFCENPDIVTKLINGEIDEVEDWTHEEGCIVDCPFMEADEAKENVLGNIKEVVTAYRRGEADTDTLLNWLENNKWQNIDADVRYYTLLIEPIVREVWEENKDYFEERR